MKWLIVFISFSLAIVEVKAYPALTVGDFNFQGNGCKYAAPPYDDSSLSPVGFESVTKMPCLPVFKATNYGAVHDGVTNDAPAINLALSAAEAAGGGIIYLEAGTYDVESSTAPAYIFTITSSNIVFLGAGPTQTHLVGWMPGHQDPATHWAIVDPTGYYKIGRFNMFALSVQFSTNVVTNIQFRSLDMNGQAGWTGNYDVGGDTATGDGWDLIHKAIFETQAIAGETRLVFNCTTENWRGEHFYGGGTQETWYFLNGKYYSTNASCISVGSNVFINNVVTGGTDTAHYVYNGAEQSTLEPGDQQTIQFSTFTGAQANGFVTIGAPNTSYTFDHCYFNNDYRSILMGTYTSNLTVTNSTFTGDHNSIIESGGGPFFNINFSSNVFANAGGYIFQDNDEYPFNFIGNYISSTTMFSGQVPNSTGTYLVSGNTFANDTAADDTGGGFSNQPFIFKNNNRLNTFTLNAGQRIDTFGSADTLFMEGPSGIQMPLSDVITVNAHPNTTTEYLTMSTTTVALYPQGFTTTFYNYQNAASGWVLKSSAAWNNFGGDIPINVSTGVKVFVNSSGLFQEL